jgi:hypothetical protein
VQEKRANVKQVKRQTLSTEPRNHSQNGESMEIEPFVDATKAAEFVNLRPRRLLQLAREGSIPAYPIGNGERRVWRFRLSEIASALATNAIKCTDAAVRTRKEMV